MCSAAVGRATCNFSDASSILNFFKIFFLFFFNWKTAHKSHKTTIAIVFRPWNSLIFCNNELVSSLMRFKKEIEVYRLEKLVSDFNAENRTDILVLRLPPYHCQLNPIDKVSQKV